MKLFTVLYQKTLSFASHPKAPWFLSGVSFAESSFFPIPPDVLLAPMCLARPNKSFTYAALATIFSVFGGVLGYLLGFFLFELIEPLMVHLHWMQAFNQSKTWFAKWGIWVVFIAGFSPVPYKVFTITAGVVSLAFIPFVLVSLLGRGARFFLVAALVYFIGKPVQEKLQHHVEIIGWFVSVLLVIVLLWLWFIS